ncbi:MAG: transcription activator effector binding protein [Puniceicoccaceae bacterium 5H]|nr:MAG: transcription activator effector binding protein [Puniceicoccaceae bacterium 5H]
MQPTLVSLSAPPTVVGRSVRTTHHQNDLSDFSPIGQLWSRYLTSDFPSQIARGGERIYGVYHEFESGQEGAYTVLAGMDNVSACDHEATVCLEPGRYLVFAQRGPKNEASIAAWRAAWEYFSQPDCPHRRRFATDFEQYLPDDTVELHISIE